MNNDAGSKREQALQVLAKFAKTAPGRLPQRVQDALAIAAITPAEQEKPRASFVDSAEVRSQIYRAERPEVERERATYNVLEHIWSQVDWLTRNIDGALSGPDPLHVNPRDPVARMLLDTRTGLASARESLRAALSTSPPSEERKPVVDECPECGFVGAHTPRQYGWECPKCESLWTDEPVAPRDAAPAGEEQ